MSGVFLVATLRFKDVARYRLYQKRFPEAFAASGGALLAADEAPRLLDGVPVDKVVIMRFESADAADAFLASPLYIEISGDRIAGAETSSWMVRAL